MPRKKKPNAVRIDHTKACIPPPTEELIQELAVGIHLAVQGRAALTLEITQDKMKSWNELSTDTQDMWIQGARIADGIVSIHGGGTVEEI